MEPAPAPGERSPTSTAIKVLLGCAVAAGVLVVAGIAVVGYGIYWVWTPGRQVPTALVIGPQTRAVVRATDLGADPGFRAVLAKVFTEVQKADVHRASLPPIVRRMQEWNRAQAAGQLGQWLPTEATLSLERGPGGDFQALAAVNFRSYVRLVRSLFERTIRHDPTVKGVPHGSHTVLQFKNGLALSFAGGTIVLANRSGLVGSFLDGLDRAPLPLSEELARLQARWDVYGSVDDPDLARMLAFGLLWDVAARPEAEGPPPGVTEPERALFGVDVRSEDEVTASFELSYPGPDAAASSLPWWGAALEELAGRARVHGLRLESRASQEGPKIRAEARLTGLSGAIERLVQESQAPAESP